MSLLTSSHYIQADYLQPLPTSMDAKSSPLAMLAQTCNNIGKDSKSLVSPFEKDKKKDIGAGEKGGRESTASNSGSAPSSLTKDSGTKGLTDKLASPSKDIMTFKGVDISKRGSPPISKREDEYHRSSSRSPKDRDTKSADRPSSSVSQTERTAHSSSSLLPTSTSSSFAHSNGYSKSALDSLYPSPLSLPGYLSLNGYPFASGLANASTAAILAAHKHNPESVRYTTVRTASGATTLVPICSDPYCMYCKVTLQSVQLASPSTCSAGCVQCTHDKGPVGLPPAYPSSSLASGLLGMSSLHNLSSAYSSAAAAAASNSGLPYVCSWIGSSGFCGKRYGSSDELVQHLRTHTTTLDTPTALTPSAFPLAGLGISAGAGLASHFYPSSLGSISPSIAALRQAYPRSLSPTSVLAASRFHPYLKSSLSSLPPGLDSSSLPPVHPSLGAYSSLYSLYGHKLGVP